LYGSWPFILAKYKEDFLLAGFIWNNPSETYVKLTTQNYYNKTQLLINETLINNELLINDTLINNETSINSKENISNETTTNEKYSTELEKLEKLERGEVNKYDKSNNLEQPKFEEKLIKTDKKTVWISESGIIDISLFADPKIINFYFKFHKLIGFANLPPLFSLGYHQSRWNYKDTQDLIEVDKKFDEHNIPYDTIWLDIEVIIYY